MRWIIAGVVVILLALVVPPASASHAELSPLSSEVPEANRMVVLTLSKTTPGRVVYRTSDGSCETWTDGNPANVMYAQTVCEPTAKASEDYGAVSGEALFTEPGSKTIMIPIYDDDVAERDEAFSIEAHEVDHTAGGATGSTAVVHIDDDDSGRSEEPAAAAATSTTTAGGRPPSSAAVPALPPARSPVGAVPVPLTTTTTTAPLLDLEVELASGDLRPGPGFELVSDGGPQSGRPRGGGGGRGGSASWLGFGLGSGAVGAGGVVVWVRRQRRWSSTRP